MDAITWFKWCLVIMQVIVFSFGAIFGITWEKYRNKLDKDEEV